MGEKYKVGPGKPPLEHRFSKTNPPPRGPRGPYLTSFLKRCLEKNIKYEDPETQKMIKGKVKEAIVWRYILNATQGENQAIEGIFDRIDGKLKTNGNGRGSQNVAIYIVRPNAGPDSHSDTRIHIERACVAKDSKSL